MLCSDISKPDAHDLVISLANHPPSPVLFQVSRRDHGIEDWLDLMGTTYSGNVVTQGNFDYDNFVCVCVCV